jgi:anti-sigma B factor antagonist
MPQDPLVIEDVPGPKEGQRILRLTGPLTMTTLFDFQSRVRADNSRALLLDFSNVPYVDSAGIGALVGAYVTHQKDGHSLYLIGVNDRVHSALKVTRVEQFFHFVDSVSAAEQALGA